MNTTIRLAVEADAQAIADLVYTTSVACCFTSEQPCPEWYRDSVGAGPISALLQSTNMVWLVALQTQAIAGVLAVSDRSHVNYFFVHPAFHKLGIGRQLWQFAQGAGTLGPHLTVRSSLFAVPVYERLGFKATEPPEVYKGLCYQTMETRHAA